VSLSLTVGMIRRMAGCWISFLIALAATGLAGWAVGSRQWATGVKVRDRALARNQAFCRELQALVDRYR
jgi:hypothetical protein